MVVASFFCKHLLLDWRLGERYFAAKLLDFELASNVGGWQWASGSGCDAAPYFRVFNPESQLKKFDPSGAYVRRWVPELAKLPDRYLHKPWTAPASVLATAGIRPGQTYPAPIVDHDQARERALAGYARTRKE